MHDAAGVGHGAAPVDDVPGGEPQRPLEQLARFLELRESAPDPRESTYQASGEALKAMAKFLQEKVRRGVDMPFHLKNNEFACILIDTQEQQAATVAVRLEDAFNGLGFAGLAVKINAVALKGVNDDEIVPMVDWAHARGMDITFIEVMPMGDIGGESRLDQYLPLSLVRSTLGQRWTLEDIDYKTGGPARYTRCGETGGRIGFITPMTHNFCESCNRVRLTCTGTLYMCLGQEDAADLRAPLRQSDDDGLLETAIDEAISRKPKGHDFVIDRRHSRPAVVVALA